MKSRLLNTASAAMFTVGILAAPFAYAQQSNNQNAPAATQTPGGAQTPGTTGGANTMPNDGTGTGQGNAASPGSPTGPTSGTNTPADNNTTTGTDAGTTPGTANTTGANTPGTTNGMNTAQTMGTTMPLGQLQDRPIQNPQGEDLADLDDVIVSPDGRITDAIVSFGGFLGLGAKKVKISWEEFSFDNGKKVLILAKSNDEINAMPDYKEPDAPPQPDSNGNASSNTNTNGAAAPMGGTGTTTGTGTGTGGTPAP